MWSAQHPSYTFKDDSRISALMHYVLVSQNNSQKASFYLSFQVLGKNAYDPNVLTTKLKWTERNLNNCCGKVKRSKCILSISSELKETREMTKKEYGSVGVLRFSVCLKRDRRTRGALSLATLEEPLLLSQFWISPLFHVQFCFFLSYIQVFQEADNVVWYSHLFKNFWQFVVIHTNAFT